MGDIDTQIANLALEEDDSSPKSLNDKSPGHIVLRAILTSKEAGIIIGKGGANVEDLRLQYGVKAGVSKVVTHVVDRILSIGGSVDDIAKAFQAIATSLSVSQSGPAATGDDHATRSVPLVIRLLVAHTLMGSIIGKQGVRIKQIQDSSSVRMVAAKEMLPQSTERIVEVQGTPTAIGLAIREIATCLLADSDKAQGTIYYHPGVISPESPIGGSAYSSAAPQTGGLSVLNSSMINHFAYSNNNNTSSPTSSSAPTSSPSSPSASRGTPRRTSYGTPFRSGGNNQQTNGTPRSNPRSFSSSFRTPQQSSPLGSNQSPRYPDSAAETPSPQRSRLIAGLEPDDPNLRTQNISFPADMIGCIIGRGGNKISEIRKLSGSRIQISREPNPTTGERLFSIIGTTESNEKALFLLYSSLEAEKERRGREEAPQLSE